MSLHFALLFTIYLSHRRLIFILVFLRNRGHKFMCIVLACAEDGPAVRIGRRGWKDARGRSEETSFLARLVRETREEGGDLSLLAWEMERAR
jgi:hypothetical protein